MLEIIGNILCAMLVFAGLGLIISALDLSAGKPCHTDAPAHATRPMASAARFARFLLGIGMIAAAILFANQLHEQASGASKKLGGVNELITRHKPTAELDALIEQERERIRQRGQ